MQADTALLQRVRANDPAALSELYDAFAPALYAYIYRRVGEQRLAEDLTSEVFVKALDALRKEHFASASLRAWLYRLAHNLVMDYYRRDKGDLPLDEWVPAPDSVPETVQRRRWQSQLRAALGQLTAEQQQVVVLRFGEGQSAAEVARALGKTEESIRALQHRALAALRRWLGEDYP
jgi:RNA polymerase sigma-70 factor (ECF subfamily)